MKTYESVGETIYSFVHKSGLPVYVLRKQGFAKSYALFATDFGSINNVFTADGVKIKLPDGVAHFLEHKLFEEQEGNVFEKFSALGASANAYTSFDLTGYLFSATDHFYESLEVLIKFVQNPYFTEDNVQKEKGIIGQEIDMYRDDPAWNCFFGMLQGMYHNHPVRHDIAGSADSIAQIDKTLLYQCYNAYYAPKNMVLFLAGDVDPQKVQEIVDTVAVDRPSPNIVFSLPEEPETVKDAEMEAEFMVAKPMFTLGFKEQPMEDAVYAEAVYDVLGTLIFGKSMPLYKQLYDALLVGDAYSFGYTAGHGYAFMQLDGESDDPIRVREMVVSHIEKMRAEGIKDTDFERVKKSVIGKALRQLDSVEQTANNFVPIFFRGGDYMSFCDTVRNLTLADVENVLRNGFGADRTVLSIIRPKGCEE